MAIQDFSNLQFIQLFNCNPDNGGAVLNLLVFRGRFHKILSCV